MSTTPEARGGTPSPAPDRSSADQRYVAWFHELDAWTEYWDIYHPETHGRYYFGDGAAETGLLTRFLPSKQYPPAWVAWTRLALEIGPASAFTAEIAKEDVRSAIMEIDALISGLFARHFGDAADTRVRADYLEGTFRFAIDTLPPASERAARIPDDDPRKRTADRHALDGDLMWFAWPLQNEAAREIAGPHDSEHARRSLMLSGIAIGCPGNFAWRGHRRTRAEYRPDDRTAALLLSRGRQWASDFDAAAAEIHALYRIREWGE